MSKTCPWLLTGSLAGKAECNQLLSNMEDVLDSRWLYTEAREERQKELHVQRSGNGKASRFCGNPVAEQNWSITCWGKMSNDKI